MGTRGEGFWSHGRLILIALVWQPDGTTRTTLDMRLLCTAVTCVRAVVVRTVCSLNL